MIQLHASRLRRWFLRLAGRWPSAKPRAPQENYAFAVPFAHSLDRRAELNIAVVVHVFHIDLLDELRNYFEFISAPCDLLVTTDSDAKKQAIETSLSSWAKGQLTISVVPNRGRDIGPKLTAFAHLYSYYDLLLFAHTKRSDTVEWGGEWRKQILATLCGSHGNVRSVFDLFEQDKELGIVAPVNFPRVHSRLAWGDRKEPDRLAQSLNIKLDYDGLIDFPAGSMFWARPAALKPLLDLELSASHFPEEDGQTNDTLAHAVERVFLVAAELAGYHWCKVSTRNEKERPFVLCEIDPDQALADQPPIAAMKLRGKMYRDQVCQR